MTRDAVPHGPTSPLGDVQPRPGTSGARGYAERQIAAEGRATGPTEGEIEAAAVTLLRWDAVMYDRIEPNWTEAAELALAAALPLIEARLREQIAEKIEGEVTSVLHAYRLAARAARGQTTKETR